MSRRNCQDLMKEGIRLLESAGVPDARVSVETILSKVLRKPRYSLYLEMEHRLEESVLDTYRTLLLARRDRYPLQYLMQTVGFRNILLEVGPGCLIPRPETEILVDVVLKMLRELSLQILDVGTGSGNIAISLAKERTNWFLTGTDISGAALSYARLNGERNGVGGRIQFIQTDLCSGIGNVRFDAVVSNPPYLSERDMKSLQPEVAYEPSLSLDGGSDGFGFLKRIAQEAPKILKPGGRLFLEFGAGQSAAVLEILKENDFTSVEVTKDDSGIDRIVSARLIG